MSVYTYVETTLPETRKPPVTEIGALGWMRKNLFGTWYDALLTISFGVLIVYAAIGLANWIVGTAQWDVIVNNLRLFGSGRYPPDQAWRAGVAALIVAALAGMSWGLWGRLMRSTAMLLGAGLAILLILPVVGSLFPIPPIHALVSAAPPELPPPLIFVGDQGQAVRLTLTPVTGATETPKGFIGTASRTAWGEFRRTTTEQGPADIVATVRLQDGRLDTLETLRVQADGKAETIEVSLPAAGWYVLQLEGEGTAGAAWLEIDGVEPMSSLGSAQEEYAQTYGSPPEIAGTRLRALDNAWLRFVGTRNVGDFLALHVGPGAAAVSGVALAVAVCVAVGYGLGRVARRREKLARRLAVAAWALSFPVVLLVLRGLDYSETLPYVATERWGGLVLTLVLAVVGIVAAFPIGVLAALGRRSSLPVVRVFCTLYIELVRGVPLVTVLWSANVMVPLMEPRLASVDSVIRAMVGMTLFTGAYLAENVRGGLQAIPHGQVEAARAVGMNAFLSTTLVVLPQALRAVIPAIAGLFIALFKDTSLVVIIGLLELLGIARSVISQPEYIGLQREALVFIAVIYFVFSYAMSYTSRRLEETGSGAVRKL